ncbi:hypothetical protein OIU80_04020 [Flavobacterium sp. LS1R47]|uniref:MORN repeat protein n=1 Tax=Flavobacterium frigoritolerans TaxID=2987686 RepID=A0A9X3C7I8_9FLAO|nr:hypothetical protein [Flavobacterium frigoritolerans]MCV9931437.1 hypothetical protein [Flavobacterium frigoritolerans]
MKNKIILVVISVTLFGVLLFHFCFKDDRVHTLKQYFPDTKTTDISEYIIRNGDTIFEGKYSRYNKKGIKIAEGQFIDNEPNGICSYYYDDGKIESTHYKENSKITLESTFYDTIGLINKYVMYNDFGKSCFIISYDEKGVREYRGYPILEVYQYKFTHKKQYNIKTEQLLRVGDTLKYQYLLANLPNTKRSFKVENMSIDDRDIKRTTKHNAPTRVNVEEILIKKGTNTIRAIVKYEFVDKITPVFNDTLTFDVNVN